MNDFKSTEVFNTPQLKSRKVVTTFTNVFNVRNAVSFEGHDIKERPSLAQSVTVLNLVRLSWLLALIDVH